MPRLSHCARAGGPTPQRHIDRPRHPAPQADALSRSAPSRHTPAGVPRAGTPSRRPRVSVPVCRGHETRTRITEHMSPLPAPPRPRRRARAAAPTPPLPVPPLPRSRSAAPGAAVPLPPFPCCHSPAAAPSAAVPAPAFPYRRRAAAPPPPPPISPPAARRAAPRRSATTTASLRPDGAPRTTAPAPVVGPSRSHPCRRPRQPRSGGACPPRSARSRSPFDHRIAPASARHPLASRRRRPGRHPRATSVVSAAKPGTGFARAAAPTHNRRPTARAGGSGGGRAALRGRNGGGGDLRSEAPGGCSSLIEGSGGPRAGRPTGDRPDAPARCVLPVPRSRGPWSSPATRHPPRRPGRPRRPAWVAATVRNERCRSSSAPAVVPAPGPVHATVRSQGAGVAACGMARPPPLRRRRKSSATTGPNGSCAPCRSRPDPLYVRRPRSLAPGHLVVGASAGSVIVAAASAVTGDRAAQIMPSSMTAIAAAMTRCAAAAACGVRRAARELPSAAGACAAQLQTSSTSTAGAGPPTVTG